MAICVPFLGHSLLLSYFRPFVITAVTIQKDSRHCYLVYKKATMSDNEQKPFRVVVVGGGVAGLTMSHCLSRAGIDHVVLEAYPEIVSPRGASIGFWPHGMKILSQIGCWKDIQDQCVSMQYSYNRLPNGKPITATRLWDMIQAR